MNRNWSETEHMSPLLHGFRMATARGAVVKWYAEQCRKVHQETMHMPQIACLEL